MCTCIYLYWEKKNSSTEYFYAFNESKCIDAFNALLFHFEFPPPSFLPIRTHHALRMSLLLSSVISLSTWNLPSKNCIKKNLSQFEHTYQHWIFTFRLFKITVRHSSFEQSTWIVIQTMAETLSRGQQYENKYSNRQQQENHDCKSLNDHAKTFSVTYWSSL